MNKNTNMTDYEKPLKLKFPSIGADKTISQRDLVEGDCIAFFYLTDDNLQLGIIKSFIGNSNTLKSTVVLTDGRHIPIERVHHRIKSNHIEYTK